MSETAALHSHLPAVEPRAYYERMLATLLDRSDPASPNYRPEFAASCQADARILQKALAEMDDTQLAQAVAPAPPAAESWPREQGRFTLGNPGGPGRPRKIHCVEHDSVTIVVNAISPQDLHDITRVAVAQAKEGDNAARRWIYQMAYRHSRTSINEVAALQETGITRDEHRMLLAQQHFGRQMEDIELYRQEVAALSGGPPAQPAVAAPAVIEPPAAARPEVVVADPPAASEHRVAPDAGVIEVRLAPADRPARNAQKRSETVENGPDGHPRARSNGRAEPQVA